MSRHAGNHSRDGSDAPERNVLKSLEHQSVSRLEKSADFSPKNEGRESGQKRAEVVENLVRGDMPDTARRRLDNTRDFNFSSEKEFNGELKKREPSISEGETNSILGFHDPRDNQAYVREGANTLETALHEKYHQKSANDLPTGINEGMTEYLAQDKAGGVGHLKNIDNRGREIGQHVAYEKETEAARRIAASVGDGPLRAAYFEGKTDELRSTFDAYHGSGTFDRLNDAVERGDDKTIKDIYKK